MLLFFWFNLFLEARAEILEKNRCYFWRNNVFIKSFRFLLTFTIYFTSRFYSFFRIRALKSLLYLYLASFLILFAVGNIIDTGDLDTRLSQASKAFLLLLLRFYYLYVIYGLFLTAEAFLFRRPWPLRDHLYKYDSIFLDFFWSTPQICQHKYNVSKNDYFPNPPTRPGLPTHPVLLLT